MRYALHIFPKFANMEPIERIRRKYDPLYGLIPPHITLVFPFEAEEGALAEAMERARSILRNITPFVLETAQIERRGAYFLLRIGRGNEALICLHDELYAKAFGAWFAPEYEYVPHITLGRGEQIPAQVRMDIQRCRVQEAVLECICQDDRSEILEIIRFEGGNER